MEKQQKPRGVIYLRRSTSRQEESLESQLDVALRNAARLDVHVDAGLAHLEMAIEDGRAVVGDLYVDDARTGADMERPGLAALLARVQGADRPTHVFTWSRDRLSRTERAWEAVQTEMSLRYAGIGLVFADGHLEAPIQFVGGDPFEPLRVMMEYVQSAQFRFSLAKNVLRTQAQNARGGFWNGGEPPYGFVRCSLDPASGDIHELRRGETVGKALKSIVIPGSDEQSVEQLSVVRLIHDLYASSFGGLKAIAAELNSRGIPAPWRGRTKRDRRSNESRLVRGIWTASQVASILEQPVYMGKYTWGRRSQGSAARYDGDEPSGSRPVSPDELIRDGRGRKTYRRDLESWTLVDPVIPFEPVVPPDQWLSNVKKLARRAERGGQRGVRRNRGAGTGLPLDVYCESCGRRMTGLSGNTQTEARYKCSTYLNGGKDECSHNWIDARTAHLFVLQAVRESMRGAGAEHPLRVALRQALAESQRTASTSPSEARELEAELATLVTNRKQLYRDMLATDPALREDAEENREWIEEKIRRVEVRLDDLREAPDIPPEDLDQQVEQCLLVLHDFDQYLDSIDPSQLHDVTEALGVRLVVEFERRKVGRRENVPVAATVHVGGLREGWNADGQTSCSKGGRGERI